jgi:hypothetical protein
MPSDLLLPVGQIDPAPQDRKVGVEESVTELLLEHPDLVETVTEMIEKQPTYATSLPPVREPEILVAFLFPSPVVRNLVGVAHVTEHAVEVTNVLLVQVIRCEIYATAKP